ncbi:hypothetical protein BKA65DRAFT_394507 [Rhexocercosporidium sp. MPI-PUGE-AT-0058]|nr:hypothetical protein BKA65DRAFT_394507 [Rhexocercosporidium sp. MPI-PUGE-AT-0058]
MEPLTVSNQEPNSNQRTSEINNSHKISTPYGTGLAATSPLTPGSLILELRTPNLLLVENDSLQNVCSYCILERPSLKRCSECKIPYYCSTSCQNRHWKEVHGRECKILKTLPDVPPTAVRALIVMLLRKGNELEGDGEGDWKGLESHVGELKGDAKRWEEIFLQARAGLSTNAFRITLPDNSPVGLCFSPTLARANHSCTPNAFIVFDSRTVSLRALRPIKREEQIFISYIDPTDDLSSRQSKLKHRYFFTCKCARCEHDENAYEYFFSCRKEEETGDECAKRMDVLYPQQELVKTAEHCQASLTHKSTLTSTNLSKSISLLNQSHSTNHATRISHLLNAVNSLTPLTTNKIFALPPYPEILHEIYLAYIDAQAFVPALVTLLFLFINCDLFIYPQPYHPVRVVRLYTIAKLLKHVASLTSTELLHDISTDLRVKEEIAKTIQGMDLINSFHVVIILVWSEAKRSHGEESTFVREVEAEIREVEEVQRLRGPTGERLRRWMGDLDSAEGRREAERVCGGLRMLVGVMGGILGW